MEQDHVKFRSSKALLMSVMMVIYNAYQTIYIPFKMPFNTGLFNFYLSLMRTLVLKVT